jgi:Ca2+-binding EF-hand superfamily protein
MKTISMNKKQNFTSKFRQAGILLSFPIFLFGAISCSPDTREGDQETAEEVNTELESTEWEAREGQSEWNDKNNENVVNTPESGFEELDTDRDQRLTYEEFEAATREKEDQFNSWDLDNDQQFSERELNEGLFRNWDKNRDGMLDGEEYRAYNTAWGERYGDNFTAWDRNRDSQLDQDEFNAGATEAGIYDAWDTDGDGVISRDELRRGSFDTRDADRDSYLTNEEFQEIEYNLWGFNDL